MLYDNNNYIKQRLYLKQDMIRLFCYCDVPRKQAFRKCICYPYLESNFVNRMAKDLWGYVLNIAWNITVNAR